MKKLRLDAEKVAVESFATAAERARTGTVRANGDDCTWFESCFCDTAYAVCGTGPATIHSCTYTGDERCGRDTSYEQCVVSFAQICEATENC
jgi:hypothetical protein